MIVITPATVPVCTPTSVAPFVEPAGTVMRAVRPPVENTTVGSSAPLSGVKVSVSVTTTSTGNVLPSETPTRSCCSAPALAEMPPKFNGGVAGSTKLTRKVLRCARAALSFTVTTMVAAPGAVGVPVIAPAAEMLRPSGSPVAEKVSGVVPPDAPIEAEYAVPTVPLGRLAVVMISGAATTFTLNVFVCGVLPGAESFTVTVTVNVPAVFGVPAITGPLAVTPSGRPVTVQL